LQTVADQPQSTLASDAAILSRPHVNYKTMPLHQVVDGRQEEQWLAAFDPPMK
jgi:hypothetical protein